MKDQILSIINNTLNKNQLDNIEKVTLEHIANQIESLAIVTINRQLELAKFKPYKNLKSVKRKKPEPMDIRIQRFREECLSFGNHFPSRMVEDFIRFKFC